MQHSLHKENVQLCTLPISNRSLGGAEMDQLCTSPINKGSLGGALSSEKLLLLLRCRTLAVSWHHISTSAAAATCRPGFPLIAVLAKNALPWVRCLAHTFHLAPLYMITRCAL